MENDKKEGVKVEEVSKVEEVKEVKNEQAPNPEQKPPMRQIVIETDGNSIELKKAEVSGNIELVAILETLAKALSPKLKN